MRPCAKAHERSAGRSRKKNTETKNKDDRIVPALRTATEESGRSVPRSSAGQPARVQKNIQAAVKTVIRRMKRGGRLRQHTIKADGSLFRVTGAPDRDERARPHAFAVTSLVQKSSPAPRGALDRRPGNTAARIFTGIPKPVPAKTRKRRTARSPSRRRPFPRIFRPRKVFPAASEEKSSFGRSLFPEFPLDPPGEDHRTDG